MCGKVTGCIGARIWVGWICLMGVSERVEEGACCYSQVEYWLGFGWGEAEGWAGYIDPYTAPGSQHRVVDARISSPFSELKLAAPSSCGIFIGENKCLDQGTVKF